jgi:hypothetical protein
MSIREGGGAAAAVDQLNNSSAAHLLGPTEESVQGRDTLEMQRRLLEKTKTDKVNTLLKKSKWSKLATLSVFCCNVYTP